MSNNSNSTNFWTRFANFMQNYFALNPYIITQAEAEQSIREGVSFRGTNPVSYTHLDVYKRQTQWCSPTACAAAKTVPSFPK